MPSLRFGAAFLLDAMCGFLMYNLPSLASLLLFFVFPIWLVAGLFSARWKRTALGRGFSADWKVNPSLFRITTIIICEFNHKEQA